MNENYEVLTDKILTEIALLAAARNYAEEDNEENKRELKTAALNYVWSIVYLRRSS